MDSNLSGESALVFRGAHSTRHHCTLRAPLLYTSIGQSLHQPVWRLWSGSLALFTPAAILFGFPNKDKLTDTISSRLNPDPESVVRFSKQNPVMVTELCYVGAGIGNQPVTRVLTVLTLIQHGARSARSVFSESPT